MTPLDQFIGTCSRVAQQLGLKVVLVAAQDPTTGECRVVMSADAAAPLAQPVADKLGLIAPGTDFDGSTIDWPGT